MPSRHVVRIDRHGTSCRAYWAPKEAAYRSEDDYISATRELLDKAVAAAVADSPRVAISTSGGLDSSAIAATVARLGTVESITCFTMLPPEGTQIDAGPFRYFDERDKVTALARTYPQIDVRWVAPEALHTLDHDYTGFFCRTYLPVFGVLAHSWYAHLSDAVRAAGHRVLLIGNYGNIGLSWGGRFALLDLLRGGSWRDFAHELRACADKSSRNLGRTFAGDVLIPALPPPLRRVAYRLRGRDPDSVAHYSALNPAFVAEHRLARQWRRRGFDSWFGGDAWHPRRYRGSRMFDQSQVFRDLFGIIDDFEDFELRDPYRDRRLLELMLSVPESMFRRNGIHRSFARKVLADRLPPEILNERRRGAQVPDWFRRLTERRQEMTAELQRIEGSPLARRLIDVPRLKALVAQWPRNEAEAHRRAGDYEYALPRGVHVGNFIRWFEGGNA